MRVTGLKLAARLTPFLPAGKQPWLPGSVLPGCGTALGPHQHKSDASHLTSLGTSTTPPHRPAGEGDSYGGISCPHKQWAVLSSKSHSPDGHFSSEPKKLWFSWDAQSKWSNSAKYIPDHSLELIPNASYSAPWEMLFKALERNCHNAQSQWDGPFFSGLGTLGISVLSSIPQ